MTWKQCLGGLLALVILSFSAAGQISREKIEWLDVWIPDTNERGLPRVLLVGDSITRGYGKQVEAGLKGKAYVARLATSKSLGKREKTSRYKRTTTPTAASAPKR